MTARCALGPYIMDALKIFESPWQRPHPRQLFPKLLMVFVTIDRMKVRTKFEVRIALHVPENFAYFGQFHGYAHAPFSPKVLMGFSSDGPCESRLPAKFDVKSLALPVPEIIGRT